MIDVEAIKRKYRAKIKPGWPIKGDSVHFTDRFNGHKYYGTVLEWERTGPREEDIFGGCACLAGYYFLRVQRD